MTNDSLKKRESALSATYHARSLVAAKPLWEPDHPVPRSTSRSRGLELGTDSEHEKNLTWEDWYRGNERF
ncbi:uncharacterized protein N7484_002653 [Penicillium longicatenatum]|uniref:uncharacterized protein n=1 Tax=Penicillium longicatenatum TaxID=1561947 RepID=UPI0025483774|nr:uncharacterized protein N7484_002653 [Penicillium longicatenatum]KAJ5648930.1 hypothetical protein N7484_002653 [Penicillium longicatenatum]